MCLSVSILPSQGSKKRSRAASVDYDTEAFSTPTSRGDVTFGCTPAPSTDAASESEFAPCSWGVLPIPVPSLLDGCTAHYSQPLPNDTADPWMDAFSEEGRLSPQLATYGLLGGSESSGFGAAIGRVEDVFDEFENLESDPAAQPTTGLLV